MNKTNKLSLLKNKHNNFMNCFIVNVFKISFLIIFVLIQVSCGSFQPVSYYSDGIYSSDNVIVIRKSDLDNDSNSYSRYFDQVARQYDWDDRRNDVVLSDIDSINSNSIDNYKTNPQWGVVKRQHKFLCLIMVHGVFKILIIHFTQAFTIRFGTVGDGEIL